MQLNLPDLTFSRASNNALFHYLLSNWCRAVASKETNQKTRNSRAFGETTQQSSTMRRGWESKKTPNNTISPRSPQTPVLWLLLGYKRHVEDEQHTSTQRNYRQTTKTSSSDHHPISLPPHRSRRQLSA
jgi:hypothetical protein